MKIFITLFVLACTFGLVFQSFSIQDDTMSNSDIISENIAALIEGQSTNDLTTICYNRVIYIGISCSQIPTLCGTCSFKPFCIPDMDSGSSRCTLSSKN